MTLLRVPHLRLRTVVNASLMQDKICLHLPIPIDFCCDGPGNHLALRGRKLCADTEMFPIIDACCVPRQHAHLANSAQELPREEQG